MHVRYIGPDTEGVYIPVLGDLHCDHGGVVEVPDAIGENLVAQHTWEAAPSPKSARAADKELTQ